MDETIIVSDLHLGSPACRAGALSEFLHKIKHRAETLVLNGDIFDSINFSRLDKHHWHVLSLLRKAARHMHVVWIAGNHDGHAEVISHLIGVEVVDECVLESGGKRVLILHGDRFDRFISDHPILTWAADRVYGLLQRVDRSHRLARLAKSSSKQYLRCMEVIRAEATKYARLHGYDVVCCGHSHQACESDGYYNSGCWTELPCTYLTVNGGEVLLKAFEPAATTAPR